MDRSQLNMTIYLQRLSRAQNNIYKYAEQYIGAKFVVEGVHIPNLSSSMCSSLCFFTGVQDHSPPSRLQTVDGGIPDVSGC